MKEVIKKLLIKKIKKDLSWFSRIKIIIMIMIKIIMKNN